MANKQEGKRFSGLDWFEEHTREVMLIGAGGIGSYVVFNLSRIGFPLYIIDPDTIDVSNIMGGQLYRSKDLNKNKAVAISEIVKEFGCTNKIITVPEFYTDELGVVPITITGLDSMKSRKTCFEAWLKSRNELPVDYKEGDEFTGADDYLFIDGRLNAENFDIFCIQGNHPEQIEEYKEKWLFSDDEVKDAECTMKATSFAGMTIGGIITACLCNWLTNRKLQAEFREIPFKQSFYLPIFKFDKQEVELNELV